MRLLKKIGMSVGSQEEPVEWINQPSLSSKIQFRDHSIIEITHMRLYFHEGVRIMEGEGIGGAICAGDCGVCRLNINT